MTLEYTFRKAGYEVFIARDGSEVLELLKEETPDIILLDIMMPNVDGYTTLQEIKKQEKILDVTYSNFAHPKQACSNAWQGNVTY
mgnify:CR=1 FL=1